MIELNGNIGEGGGQLVRQAVALAALTGQSIRITDIRGNRPRGGGLKAQHVSAIEWLATATAAKVKGLRIGSKTLEFQPSLRPAELTQNKAEIVPESPASSASLVFQAVFPFIFFAASSRREPIELSVRAGTNVSWSPSFEYLDQVLLPTLQRVFGIEVERKLCQRGLIQGPRGHVWFRVHPGALVVHPKDNPLTDRREKPHDFRIKRIDASLIAPVRIHATLQNQLTSDIATLFPEAEVQFTTVDDSSSMLYLLLVAHSESELRWGRDIQHNISKKNMGKELPVASLATKVCKELFSEVSLRGHGDEYLQDQLVCFQALAEGRTRFTRPTLQASATDSRDVVDALDALSLVEESSRPDRTDKPFGQGSLHTKTVRWVAAQILPEVSWFQNGTICEGAGLGSLPSS